MPLHRNTHFKVATGGGGTGGTGGGTTGAGTIINTGPYTDLPGWTLLVNEGFANTVAIGSMFTPSGDHGKGIGNYTHWGCQTYKTTYGSPSHSNNGDYYGTTNMGVVSGVSGATGTGNVLQMNLIANDGTGKHVGACPFPYLDATKFGTTSGTGASQLYGRYAWRTKTSNTSRWKDAWLGWPKTFAWTNEWDFFEGDFAGFVQGYVHQPNNAAVNAASWTNGTTPMAQWNEGVVEWTPSGMKFFLNGTLVLSTATKPTEQMFWQLQTETQLSGSQPTLNATQWVDSVGIWQYTP